MTDAATLQARLTEAEAALDELMLGQPAASVGSMNCTPAMVPQLRACVRDLRRQLDPGRLPWPFRHVRAVMNPDGTRRFEEAVLPSSTGQDAA